MSAAEGCLGFEGTTAMHPISGIAPQLGWNRFSRTTGQPADPPLCGAHLRWLDSAWPSRSPAAHSQASEGPSASQLTKPETQPETILKNLPPKKDLPITDQAVAPPSLGRVLGAAATGMLAFGCLLALEAGFLCLISAQIAQCYSQADPLKVMLSFLGA